MLEVLTETAIREMLDSYTRFSNAGKAYAVARRYERGASIYVSGKCIASGSSSIRTCLINEYESPERVPPTVVTGRITIQEGGRLATVEETFTEHDGQTGQVLMMVGLEQGEVKILQEWIFYNRDHPTI